MKKPANASARAGFSVSKNSKADTRNLIEAGPDPQAGLTQVSHRINTLCEPIVAAKFWRNRRGEAVVVRLKEYKGRALADIRVFVGDKTGRLVPTTKGIAVKMSKLPELAAAIRRAETKARALGLLGVAITDLGVTVDEGGLP
jgi:hypothetical protein